MSTFLMLDRSQTGVKRFLMIVSNQ